MKIIKILSIILCFYSTNIFSQFTVSINSTSPYPCVDSTIQFTAGVTDGGAPVTDVNFTWSFGDGSNDESGLNLDTIEHTYTKGGGHIVRVDAKKGADSDYCLLKYEIALEPDFSETESNRDAPICLGQQILLSGKMTDSTWIYEVPKENNEVTPAAISDVSPYSSTFDYRIFTEAQTIVTGNEIDSIGIKLEHTNLSNIRIELTCPSGTSIVLKDFGGPDKYFGVPIDDENSNEVGIGYNYYWTNSPDYGTMNSIVTSETSLPAGSYTPDDAFSLLAGCPLNGNWDLDITDNQALDKGYIFSAQLIFEASLLPGDWEISHTYPSREWLGRGVSSTSLEGKGNGLATAIPDIHGNHEYTYRVIDNFGCPQDTSLIISVEAVSLSVDPEEGPFNESFSFTNSTSWANSFEWDFGDESALVTDENPSYTYEKDGVYQALLTASTDDGCSDTASVFVTVTIPPSSLDNIPNAFSPNHSGENDYFCLPELDAIETLECSIYSRWGKKVAEWHSVEDAQEGWDGTINGGRDASPGIYFYVIKAIGFDGKVYEKKGSLHLFR